MVLDRGRKARGRARGSRDCCPRDDRGMASVDIGQDDAVDEAY